MANDEISKKSKTKDKDAFTIQDCDTFIHKTGDIYEGFFEAKKKDKSLKMHGSGVYKSAQGDTYTGQWDSDKLTANEPVTITHPDGSKYEGTFKDWHYTGPGTYTYPDGSALEGNFSDNCPIGAVRLTDPNGHLWLGNAELGNVWLEPVNHFYEMLEGRPADVVKERKKKIAGHAKKLSNEIDNKDFK